MTRTALAAIALVALLWIGGEQHRSNCLRTGRTGCTVLPWDAGQRATVPACRTAECRALQREADAIARGR